MRSIVSLKTPQLVIAVFMIAIIAACVGYWVDFSSPAKSVESQASVSQMASNGERVPAAALDTIENDSTQELSDTFAPSDPELTAHADPSELDPPQNIQTFSIHETTLTNSDAKIPMSFMEVVASGTVDEAILLVRQESITKNWATEKNAEVRDAMASLLQENAVMAMNVECRSTVCMVELYGSESLVKNPGLLIDSMKKASELGGMPAVNVDENNEHRGLLVVQWVAE
ncbi:MAG: hypothetical protein AAF004_03475 [Pseudomonadota bacterium]